MGTSTPVSAELLEAVSAGLLESRKVNTPDAARCVAEAELLRRLVSLRDSTGARKPSARVLLSHLCRARVVQPIGVAREASRAPCEIYVVGPESASPPDPMEILRAAVPSGVICYFTAVTHHSLTTQHPPFHHIARPTRSELRSDAELASSTRSASSRCEATDAPPVDRLGTLLFSFDERRYYVTNRDARRMPGVKTLFLHPTACVRITSLAQTLVDTMHRPLSCGGLAVIYEAWETAIETHRLHVDELSAILQEIGDERATRRVGYMLDAHGVGLGESLLEARRAARAAEPIALFPGIACAHVDGRWNVLTP